MGSEFNNKFILSVFKNFSRILITLLVISLTSCSVPNWAKPKKVSENRPVNVKERARQNIEQGRGISIMGSVKKRGRGTNYEFSTSNPLWRASLEIIDFMPLTTVDYSGGIIITDWYSDNEGSNDSIKITVRFLSNEIQSNSIKVIVHNKKCKVNENCSIKEIESKIKTELQKTIISKAAQIERASKNLKK